MSALALRDDQAYWDDHQLAVLEQSGIGSDVTRAELEAFLHECQRRKLDPFTRQIYLIGRFDKRVGRTVYRPQTSIDGFRLIARRAADRSGIDYAYEDTTWFDDKGGKHEVWLSSQAPAAVKVVVVRNGNRHDAVARYGAYVPTNRDGKPMGLWVSMPDTMIAKCAEALALRKAFPEDLGGLYTSDEMAQADNTAPVSAPAAQPAAGTVVKPAANGRPSQAQRPEAPATDVDPDAQVFADEASQAVTLDDLRVIHTRAREAHKLAALVCEPGGSHIDGLGRYFTYRKGVLEAAEKALAALRAAGEPVGLDDTALDKMLTAECGHGLEDATPEEMDKVTAIIRADSGAAV